MEEIRKLKIEFNDLLKQAQEDLESFLESSIKDEPDEYTAFKANIAVKNKWILNHFYISTTRKLIEQSIILHELKEKNVEQSKIEEAKKMVYHYNNFKNYVKKEMAVYSHDGDCKLGIEFLIALFNEMI